MVHRPPVLVTRVLPAAALSILHEVAAVDVADTALTPDALRAAAAGRAAVVCMLTDRIDDAFFVAAGPSLRVVANVAVGVDNIDVAAGRARGVVMTNTPDVLTNAVVECTWGLILSVARRFPEAERLLRRGDWVEWSLDFLTGMELNGKQLGIVGSGRIGRAVAARASAFGMRAVFSSRSGVRMIDGHAVMAFDELLATSDVVSVHVPLRPETRHLIGQRALGLMKPTAFLINTARGPVVDEAALVDALTRGVIAGAGLDVFEREPALSPGLLDCENVVLLPHIGSATREARTAMAVLAAKNAAAVLRGQPPLTPV